MSFATPRPTTKLRRTICAGTVRSVTAIGALAAIPGASRLWVYRRSACCAARGMASSTRRKMVTFIEPRSGFLVPQLPDEVNNPPQAIQGPCGKRTGIVLIDARRYEIVVHMAWSYGCPGAVIFESDGSQRCRNNARRLAQAGPRETWRGRRITCGWRGSAD